MITSKGIAISGGTFIQNNINSIGRGGYEALSSRVADTAFYDSEQDLYIPKYCFNTGGDLLKVIQGWVLGKDNPKASMMWLYGIAGVGKSAIARSVAAWCEDKEILLASFCFSRTDSTRNNLKHFVPTLAYAAANSVQDGRSLIGLAVENDPHIFSRFVHRQLDRLLTKPLSHLAQGENVRDIPYVIVIDGLDECVNMDEQTAVIQLFWSALFNHDHLGWKVLVTSRFDTTIQHSLDNIPKQNFSIRIDIDQYISDNNIEYNSKFTDMNRHNTSRLTVWESYGFGVLHFKLLKATSGYAQHPNVTLAAPVGTVILGGGAYVDWAGEGPSLNPGNLLTAMYPNDNGTTWTVASKDHMIVSKARIVGSCIVAHMKDGTPISADNYRVVSATSDVAAHPTLQVDLPAGFTVVGGGARVNYTGVGNMLHASYPTDGLGGWVGSAKDHLQSDPATITVWAIGLRESFLRSAGMRVSLCKTTSTHIDNHPRQTFVLPDFNLTGAGACVNWSENGNFLTAIFPQDRQTVVAEGKDHDIPDPSTITSYAIGFGVVE